MKNEELCRIQNELEQECDQFRKLKKIIQEHGLPNHEQLVILQQQVSCFFFCNTLLIFFGRFDSTESEIVCVSFHEVILIRTLNDRHESRIDFVFFAHELYLSFCSYSCSFLPQRTNLSVYHTFFLQSIANLIPGKHKFIAIFEISLN